MPNDVAIFLDLENIAIGAQQANLTFDINVVIDQIKDLTEGRIVLREAFGGADNTAMVKELSKVGFTVQSAARINSFSKNLADMQITVNAMETLINNPQLHTYVLMSGDRDFTPLVQSLRKHGKRVIGLGLRHTTSDSLESLCDQYLFYEDMVPEQTLSAEDIASLLERAMKEVLRNKQRVRASVLKQSMMELSHNAFSHTQGGSGSFRKFLEQYPDLVEIEQEDTTIYLKRPRPHQESTPLHQRYRTKLKKRRLRVVPHEERQAILRDLLSVLQTHPTLTWRDVATEVSMASVNGSGKPGHSKNRINDVMQLARQAEVIRTQRGHSLASAPVELLLKGDRMFTRAMVMCDAVYLREIQSLRLPYDLEEASMALYESDSFVPYLDRFEKAIPTLIGSN